MTGNAVSVVICAHNNRDIIGACLESVLSQDYAPLECIVMDDASSDGMTDWIAIRYPEVRVIRSQTNQGPSINRNIATELATGKYLVFMDSDVELQPGWIDQAVRYLEENLQVGMVAGKLVFAHRPDRIHSYGGEMSPLGLGWDGNEQAEAEEFPSPLVTLWASSAAMAIRRDLLLELGGFDATFFYGYEDSDLGWRITLTGREVTSLPGLIAYHRTRHTISQLGHRITFHLCKNRLRSLIKNHLPGDLLIFLPLYLMYAVADLIVRSPRQPKWSALRWNLAQLPETLDLRRKVQKSNRCPGSVVRQLFSHHLFPPVTLRARRKAIAQ